MRSRSRSGHKHQASKTLEARHKESIDRVSIERPNSNSCSLRRRSNNSGGQRSHNDTRVLGASRISKTNQDVSRIFSDGVTPTSNMSIPFNNNSRERVAGEGRQNEIMGRIMQLENELEVLRKSGLSIVSPSVAAMRNNSNTREGVSNTYQDPRLRQPSPAFSLGERSHTPLQAHPHHQSHI
jgi:hypothetical protein